VGDTEANALADKLFGYFRTDRTMSVPEALRRLRAKAAQEIRRLLDADPQPASVDWELLSYVYPFMYVYFGNPELLVSISANTDSAGTGPRDGGAGGS